MAQGRKSKILYDSIKFNKMITSPFFIQYKDSHTHVDECKDTMCSKRPKKFISYKSNKKINNNKKKDNILSIFVAIIYY